MIIFDLGGGTFDVSLLTIEEGIIDVICVNGDTKLGGNDVDTIFCEYVEKRIREMESFRNLKNLDEILKSQKEKIKSKCEFVKMNLTNQEKSVLNLSNFYNKENISLEITRNELENECQKFLNDITKILDDLFKDAKEKKKSDSYNKSKIDYIILIGGATRMPVIINFVEKYFGKKPITSFNPDETVAIGAALRGETLFNKSPYLDSLHLIDVIPLNIGVKAGIDDKLEVILKRNSYIPCKKKKIFHPMTDYQSSVKIMVFEGENKFTKDNVLLGDFILEIIPKKSIDSKIEITFAIDEHLLLHVTAEQLSEGKSKKICIKKKNQLLTNEDLEKEKKRIEETKIINNMNEEEKKKYSEIIIKKKEFFSSNNLKEMPEEEIDRFINLIENYISEFEIKENNIHIVNILFRLYNLINSKKKLEYIIKEKTSDYFNKISKIDIFYILNFISKYSLENFFQEQLIIKIAEFFYNEGITHLNDIFKEKKKISFELFQLSLKLIDNLISHNDELKKDQKISELINGNNICLNKIKINDISLKIKEIYDKNNNDEKYINQIIELYQTIVNLIRHKDEIQYLNDFDILYRLGDNNDYLPSILEIMQVLYTYIISISYDDEELRKKYGDFKNKFNLLKKYSEESKNVNQEYFRSDLDDNLYENIAKEINTKYNAEKNEPTNFIFYILEHYPPLSLSKSIDDFKKEPNIKIVVAAYSKSFLEKFSILTNKEKLRIKLHEIVSKMFSDNIELKSINENGEGTDDEGETERTNDK